MLIVNSLCDYLDLLIKDRREERKASNEELIIQSIHCIASWIMRGPWLLIEQGLQPKDRTLLHKLFSVIMLAISGRNVRTFFFNE